MEPSRRRERRSSDGEGGVGSGRSDGGVTTTVIEAAEGRRRGRCRGSQLQQVAPEDEEDDGEAREHVGEAKGVRWRRWFGLARGRGKR